MGKYSFKKKHLLTVATKIRVWSGSIKPTKLPLFQGCPHHVSNKKQPGCFRVYRGGNTTQLCGVYKKTIINILIKQHPYETTHQNGSLRGFLKHGSCDENHPRFRIRAPDVTRQIIWSAPGIDQESQHF